MAIADSHLDLYYVLKDLRGLDIHNFDQHHDYMYSTKLSKEPDCGSWLAFLLKKKKRVRSYKLFYPEWRKEKPEGKISFPLDITYGLPEKPSNYDYVFICRSSAWTPSWCDNQWLDFVNWWQKANPSIWQARATIPFVQRERTPNMNEARIIKEQQLAELEKFFDLKINGGTG